MSYDRSRLPEPVSYFEGQGLVLVGPSNAKWKTTHCAFHGGSDSMRVKVASGGFKCMSCGVGGGDVLSYHMQAHGLTFVEAAMALGAWADDGTPYESQKPTTLPPRAALEVLSFEALVVAVAAGNLAQGVTLTPDDYNRLMKCASRINRIAGEYSA